MHCGARRNQTEAITTQILPITMKNTHYLLQLPQVGTEPNFWWVWIDREMLRKSVRYWGNQQHSCDKCWPDHENVKTGQYSVEIWDLTENFGCLDESTNEWTEFYYSSIH